VVSKLWRDASKPAAAYPLRFDFDAFPHMGLFNIDLRVVDLLDNDEAMSLPYERVVGLLGETANDVCSYAVTQPERGTCPLSSTCTRTGALGTGTRALPQPHMGTCPLSSTCTRTGALGTTTRAFTQPLMGTCPLSSTCTRTGALGTTPRAVSPPYANTGTA
jgi:hypothetical protein